MSRLSTPVKRRNRAVIISTVAAISAAMCAGAIVAPASAATSGPAAETVGGHPADWAAFRTPVNARGTVNVQSFRVTGVGGSHFQQCVNIGDGGKSYDENLGALRTSEVVLPSRGVYRLTSFSAFDCQAGYGTAGSIGYINTNAGFYWTVFTGHAPARVR